VPSVEKAEGVLVRLEADIDLSGGFGARVLEVTGDYVRVLDEGPDGEQETSRVAIADIKGARNEPLVGGGRLEITLKNADGGEGAKVSLLSYSLRVAERFSEAARGIEQLAKGEELSINLKEDQRTHCEKCGRLLPEKDGICPACVQRGRTMTRIAGFLTPYKGKAIALAGLSIVSTLINLAPPYIQGTLIDRVLTPKRDINLLWMLMAAWLGALAFGVLLQIASGRLTAFLAANIAADLRAQVFRSVERLQMTYFEKKPVGSITSRVTQDTERVWHFLVEGVPYMVTNGLLFLGISTFIFLTNWKLALCILAPIPIVALVSGLSWKKISLLSHRYGQKWARFHTHLNESLSGIKVVKAFAQEDVENRKFAQRNAELRDVGVQTDVAWYTVFGVMSFFTALGALINWTVGGYFVYSNQMSLGDFWRVHAYLGLLYGPLQWFAAINNWFSRAMAGAERVFEVIDTQPEEYGKGIERPISGEVTFENIRFGYDKSNPVLKGLSFSAKPGEMIGLVGKSGAGKSTTISLLSRFHEPDAGRLLIDGHDYREWDLQDLRRQIGFVLQEPFLFNGSIAENIAYGKPEASFEEIVEAAKAANAHEFILAKPDGYDTLAGERGAKLSGGERQRVSIARAILHDPRILILDEATSSVDVETEKQMQAAIANLIKGRTVFAIAHRLATLKNATRLLVLEKGEVIEEGTHAELMEKDGEFAKLVKTQSEINQILHESI
jgi:ATP-binding cassette subfamily B protein